MMQHLEAGYILGKYRIREELGRGGMGVVYLAEDSVLGRLVALKVLPKDLMSEKAFIRKFQDEAKVIASLSHPNVVHVHSFDVIDGRPVIEMEYIEGGPLSRRFQQADVCKTDVIHYAHGVASALAYCHAMDAVHRDVKPSNILIDKLNMARLADFGIAKFLAEHEQSTFAQSVSGVFQGTPLYAPPEAWEGETPTRAWDIYGLGAVIYQGITGSPPYQANTPLQLAKMVASSSVPSVKSQADVSSELAELVEEMLLPDARRRPDNAEVIQRRLQKTPEFRSYTGDTRTMQPPRARIRKGAPRRSSGRRRDLAIALGTLVALCSFAFLAWAFRQSPTNEAAVQYDDSASGGAAANATATQADWASLTASSTVADLEMLPRRLIGARSLVLEAQMHEAAAPRPVETWLVGFSDGGEPVKIFAFSESSVAAIQLTPGLRKGAYEATGEWAGYGDAAASILRHGSLRGEIVWQTHVGGCLGNLVFLNEQDGHTTESTLVATEHATCKTGTQFSAAIERSEYLLPILYRELLPRDLAWAREVDALLPSFVQGTARVVTHGTEGGDIVVDGILNEPWWDSLGAKTDSSEFVLSGWPRAANPRMSASLVGDTLLVAWACSAGPETDAATLNFFLQDTYPAPLSAAPFLHLEYSCATSRVAGEYGTGQPMEEFPDCTFALTRRGARLTIEGRIPVRTFGRQVADIEPGERWRVNAVLSTTDASGKETPLCRWGFPDESLVRHGAVLILE